MSLSSFQLLAPLSQLYLVLKEGTYLARRLGEGTHTVDLYYIPNGKQGFYVEIGLTITDGRLVVLRSFEASQPLADYC